jgi:hypothetical protein
VTALDAALSGRPNKPRREPKYHRRSADEMARLRERCIYWARSMAPTTVRGVCYQLFIRDHLIPNLGKSATNGISRLLTEMREQGFARSGFDWRWIADYTRQEETVATWDDLADYLDAMRDSYRKSYWAMQPRQVVVWSEKSTVAGVLRPVLDEYAVPFLALHGHGSFSAVMRTAVGSQRLDRPLLLYCGVWDPSGAHMSEVDLPDRFDEYGGNVEIRRLALTRFSDDPNVPDDVTALKAVGASFDADDKLDDTRHDWFVAYYGHDCSELDAFDANVLRERVRAAIEAEIDWDAWRRAERIEQAEQQSVEDFVEELRQAGRGADDDDDQDDDEDEEDE